MIQSSEINNLNTSEADTLISSTDGLGWYIADSSFLQILTQNKLNKISSNIGMKALEGYLFLSKIKDYTLLFFVVEGEDFYTYIATTKDDEIIDALLAEGLSTTPGEEDIYSELPCFAILKNYSIKIHTQVTRNGVRSEENKIFQVNDDGKFVEKL